MATKTRHGVSVVVLCVEGVDVDDISARVAQLTEERPPVWRYRVLGLRKAFEKRDGQWHVILGVTEFHVLDLPETFQFSVSKDPSVTVLDVDDVAEIIRAGRFVWWS